MRRGDQSASACAEERRASERMYACVCCTYREAPPRCRDLEGFDELDPVEFAVRQSAIERLTIERLHERLQIAGPVCVHACARACMRALVHMHARVVPCVCVLAPACVWNRASVRMPAWQH